MPLPPHTLHNERLLVTLIEGSLPGVCMGYREKLESICKTFLDAAFDAGQRQTVSGEIEKLLEGKIHERSYIEGQKMQRKMFRAQLGLEE